ncbi:MAG: hypothetical protein AB7O59_20815 [Pirellulales bacterium]
MAMDTFAACLALGPLAIYLLVLGAINLSARPLVVNGTRELIALALAVAGLVVVGPMQLFMPEAAAAQFGTLVWALLISFYVLCLILLVIVVRPRLVVYNMTPDQLRPILETLAKRLDHESVWAGRALSLPQMRVHLVIDSFPALQNVALLATSHGQSIAGWRRLEAALREELREVSVAGRTHGVWLALCGGMILLALALRVVDDPQTIARGIDRMLHP